MTSVHTFCICHSVICVNVLLVNPFLENLLLLLLGLTVICLKLGS